MWIDSRPIAEDFCFKPKTKIMSINNPQVQFVTLKVSGQSDRSFLCVTTSFGFSDYEPAGVQSLTGPDSNGRISVELLVTRTGDALKLNKQVFHQVCLDDLDVANISSAEVKIYYGTTLLSTVVVSQEESESGVRPIDENALN